MSKPLERDCVRGCRSLQHGDILTAVLSKRAVSGELIASYARWLCANCGHVVDSHGRTSLHFAASCGRKDVAEWLVKFKEADINAKDKESGYTPLHRSIFYGNIHVAVSLIQLGANMSVVDYDGLTATEHAMKDRLPYISYDAHSPCEVYVWGTNSNYTLGTGNQQQRSLPDVLDLFRKQNINICQVAMEKFHSVFLTKDGRVFSCGHGHGGRLGLDSDEAHLTPRQMKLPTCQATGKPEVCTQVSIGKDHTVLLMESGSVYTCGLNTHHQLGHNPPPPFLLTPKALSQKVLKSCGGVVSGVCAARFHTVLWNETSLLTCGLNAGQLGHSKYDGKTIIAPKQISLLPNKEFHITHVATSDGATAVATKEGSIFVLHEYQCRRIAIKQIDIQKLLIVGGHLDAKGNADVLTDRGGEELCIAVLTRDGSVLIWETQFQQFKRSIFFKYRPLIIKDIYINRSHILMVTNDGELFQAGADFRKMKKSSQDSKIVYDAYIPVTSSKLRHGAILDTFPLKVQKLPHVYRAISISSDPKGRNFAVLQVSPREGLIEVPQVDNSEMMEHLRRLMEEADESDSIHDVIFEVGPKLRKFAAHQYIIAFQSNCLTKLISEQCVNCATPHVKLENIHPDIFEQILQFIYTGTCDLLTPGMCNIRILKEDAQKFNLCSFANEINDNKASKNASTCNKKNNNKQKNVKESVTEMSECNENEDNFCNPVRMTQEAAKRLGVLSLQKKLETVTYENGHIITKQKKIGKVINPTFSRKKHPHLCDVIIKSEDGKELKAHKCILAARLDYFYSMFSRGWAEAKNTKALHLPLPYNILEVVVNFLYEDSSAAVQDSEDLDFIANVLIIADQFFIRRLKEICEVSLASLLTLKNVYQIFNFSGMYNAEQLKKCCMNFITINLSAILESRVLEKVDEELLEELSRSYCELKQVVQDRVITPVPGAPSDDLLQSIYEAYPVSFGSENDSVYDKDKDKIAKKKCRLRKISSGDANKASNDSSKLRTRNESVSSNEEQDLKDFVPPDFQFIEEHSSPGKITLTLSDVSSSPSLQSENNNNEESSWVKNTNLSSKQKKALAARLKVISAIQEDGSVLDKHQSHFTKLVSSSQSTPVKSVPKSVEIIKSPPLKDIQLTNMDFPELQRSPPQHDNGQIKNAPKQGDMKKIMKVSQKVRKKLAADNSEKSSPSMSAWTSSISGEHTSGSPIFTYSLLDVMRQEVLLSRNSTPAIPIPRSNSRSPGMLSTVSGTMPVAESPSPPITNPWTRLERCSPISTRIDATPPLNFTDIIADEKKQRDKWTKMRTKHLQLTQMEDQAIEDLISFYNAAGATEERITVRRVSTGAVATPVWVTSHH